MSNQKVIDEISVDYWKGVADRLSKEVCRLMIEQQEARRATRRVLEKKRIERSRTERELHIQQQTADIYRFGFWAVLVAFMLMTLVSLFQAFGPA